MGQEFVQISLPPLLVAMMVALMCAMAGNFLILRRQALLGDAVSHAVLPGIVAAFLLAGDITPATSLAGALGAALLAMLMTGLFQRIPILDPPAVLGMVYTVFFAAGVVLLELSDTSSVHLDVEHALYGNLESVIWLEADQGWASLLDRGVLAHMPDRLVHLPIALLVLAGLIRLGWRALVVTSFDVEYARSLGFRPHRTHLLLLLICCTAVVFAFDAVGAILTVAMLILPPAMARLLTHSLRAQWQVSLGIAPLIAALGVILAGEAPGWLGYDRALSAAGVIATLGGCGLLVCVFLRHAGGQSRNIPDGQP